MIGLGLSLASAVWGAVSAIVPPGQKKRTGQKKRKGLGGRDRTDLGGRPRHSFK